MSDETALTTYDNPYSPFSQFDSWYSFDCEKGYDCCGYLDRMMQTLKNETSYLSSEEEERLIDDSIDRIVKYDPTGLFVKVVKLNKSENGKDFKVINVNE